MKKRCNTSRFWIVWVCFWVVLLFIGCGGGDDTSGSSTTAGGESETITGTDGDAGSYPEAFFTVSVAAGSYPLSVQFNASGSTDDDGIGMYEWDFGDGVTGDGVEIWHTYQLPGNYTAQLTVTNLDGLSDTATRGIDVSSLYSISGAVGRGDYVMADSDINDPNAPYTANDSIADAQKAFVPCSVSGYVNVAGTGADGRSFTAGDVDDFYQVDLTSGMQIALYMAEDPGGADLNLYLWDSDESQVGASITSDSAVETLSSPGAGTYYVQVEAGSSASAYTLTIGLSVASTVSQPLSSSYDFVPGEVLVRFEEDGGDDVTHLAGSGGHVSSMGFYTRSGDGGRDRLLKRSTAVDDTTFFTRLGVQSDFSRSLSHGSIDDENRARLETLWMVRALRNQPGVVYAEPNYIVKAFATTPDDTYYGYQWHYPLIDLPDAWEITTGSEGEVVVAVLDTGVLLTHPDLSGQLVDGYDFVDGDDDPTDEYEDCFHGTHVTGTIAAASNNGTGVAGVAWNQNWSASVMPLRVLDDTGSGSMDDILAAVRYAAGLGSTDDGDTLAAPVDVINLSLGGGGYSSIAAATFQEARDEGVIVIAAAGNEASSEVMYPAGYDGVVSVSAVGYGGSFAASYSNYGSTIDVAAPGGTSADNNDDGYVDGVLSTCAESSGGTITMGYAFLMGTSMATPHVSGVVALMKAFYPELTPGEFDLMLAGGYLTQDLGSEGWDQRYGWGLINAYQAVSMVENGGIAEDLPAILSVSPKTLSFGASLTSADVAVSCSGGDLVLESDSPSWSASATWLTVTATGDVDEMNGMGTYTVTVSREGLSAGLYSDTISFATEDSEVQVSVTMRVASDSEAADNSYYYILLIDSETYDVVAQSSGPEEDGICDYTFSDLSSGDTYLIFAGTDPDNDYYICGDGEICGAYLSLENPAVITVTGELTGIDFVTDTIFTLSSDSGSLGTAMDLSLQRFDTEGTEQ